MLMEFLQGKFGLYEVDGISIEVFLSSVAFHKS